MMVAIPPMPLLTTTPSRSGGTSGSPSTHFLRHRSSATYACTRTNSDPSAGNPSAFEQFTLMSRALRIFGVQQQPLASAC